MATNYAKNLASGTLAESVSASTTTLLVYVGEGGATTIKNVWPDAPFYATIMPENPSAGVPNSLDSEIVKVTAVGTDGDGNTTLTVTRGQRNTTTKSFTAGAIVTNANYTEDAVFANIDPPDFFTNTEETVSGSGTEFTISPTLGFPLTSAELKGDTDQQTYSGKNMYANSQDFGGSGWNNADGWETDNATYNGLVVKKRSGTWQGLSKDLNVESGKTYTFSLFAKAETNRNVTIYLQSSGGASISPYNKDINLTPEWQRFSFTFTPSSSGIARPRLENRESFSTPTYISGYQLEENSTASNYEPYVGGIPAPNPDYPQEVQVVTGEQTVTITDGAEESQEYTVDLGNIELCKIGTYQDYIYKSGDDWYVHKAIVKYIFDGSESWGIWGSGTQNYYYDVAVVGGRLSNTIDIYSNYGSGAIIGRSNTNQGIMITDSGTWCRVRYGAETAIADWKSKLSTTNMSLYFPLATPTDTQITNTALIDQLNALAGATTYNGSTSFTVDGNGNLAAVLDATTARKNLAGLISVIKELA